MNKESANLGERHPFGLLSISKPRGKTSFEVVGMLRKALHVKKVGHTGTLDPIASGLLLLCVGRATRLLDYLMDLPKTYIAWMKLGVTTDTLDSTGKVMQIREVPEFTPEEVEEVLDEFRGDIQQTPPVFSAIKRNGKKLYVLAREGIQAEVEPRDIAIHDLSVQSLTRSTISFKISCSKGTYIRSICADIGERLGCGAHVFRLQRTHIGGWDIEDAVPYSRLFALSRNEILDMLQPIESILPDYKRAEVSPLAEHFAINGMSIDIDQVRISEDIEIGEPVLLRTWRGKLIGVFRAEEPTQDDLKRRPSLPLVLSPEKVLLTSTPPKQYPPKSKTGRDSGRPRRSFGKRRGPGGGGGGRGSFRRSGPPRDGSSRPGNRRFSNPHSDRDH
ncbi:MAG: tRNA pseudouridine(55) synthase TruB [Candidatus Coatesbacteria bacterium]|nr:tRNA pseudouridine(55) synthase TruB [Candidatus Coatesbacteria bacterium]